jgi:hypothetical protein
MSAAPLPPDRRVPEVTCRCGRRLKLPGATPGRVGRCPSCGAKFRVGGAPEAAPRPKPPAPRAIDDEEAHIGAGYALAPADEPPPPADVPGAAAIPRRRPAPASSFDSSKRRLRKRPEGERLPIGPVGRGGILPLPKHAEQSALGSLKYPLWDGLGLACLVLLPIPLTVTSLVVFVAIPLVMQGGVNLIFGPITFGFIAVFAIALGYALAALGAVLVASAHGDIHHPRWPDVDFGAIAGSLVRWAVPWGIGLALAAWPAIAFARSRTEMGWLDRLILAEILAAGGVYALVALLSVYLHESVAAADPRLVAPAIGRLGAGLLGPLLLLLVAVAGGVLAVVAIYRVAGFSLWALIGSVWVAWIYAVYAGLVVVRATGRAYELRARKIGWFPTERRRVEEPIAPAPQAPAPEI